MKIRNHKITDSAIGLTADERLKVQEEIKKHAYELWLKNGCHDGNDLDNWLQAERELTNSHLDGQRTASARILKHYPYEH